MITVTAAGRKPPPKVHLRGALTHGPQVLLHALGPRSANCPRREVELNEPVVPIARSGVPPIEPRADAGAAQPWVAPCRYVPGDMDPTWSVSSFRSVDMLELHESLLGLDEIDEVDEIDLKILDAFEDAAGVVGRAEPRTIATACSRLSSWTPEARQTHQASDFVTQVR